MSQLAPLLQFVFRRLAEPSTAAGLATSLSAIATTSMPDWARVLCFLASLVAILLPETAGKPK